MIQPLATAQEGSWSSQLLRQIMKKTARAISAASGSCFWFEIGNLNKMPVSLLNEIRLCTAIQLFSPKQIKPQEEPRRGPEAPEAGGDSGQQVQSGRGTPRAESCC